MIISCNRSYTSQRSLMVLSLDSSWETLHCCLSLVGPFQSYPAQTSSLVLCPVSTAVFSSDYFQGPVSSKCIRRTIILDHGPTSQTITDMGKTFNWSWDNSASYLSKHHCQAQISEMTKPVTNRNIYCYSAIFVLTFLSLPLINLYFIFQGNLGPKESRNAIRTPITTVGHSSFTSHLSFLPPLQCSCNALIIAAKRSCLIDRNYTLIREKGCDNCIVSPEEMLRKTGFLCVHQQK